MSEENSELKDFIQETLRQIDEGVGEQHNVQGGEVEFDVAITKRTEKSGKMGIMVLGQGVHGEAAVEDEKVSRVKFTAQMRRAAEIRRAEENQAKHRALQETQAKKNWALT